jgi:hypothetical protein
VYVVGQTTDDVGSPACADQVIRGNALAILADCPNDRKIWRTIRVPVPIFHARQQFSLVIGARTGPQHAVSPDRSVQNLESPVARKWSSEGYPRYI